MPIGEVVLFPEHNMTLASIMRYFWIRELCTIYPYSLNDNVRGLGNISRIVHDSGAGSSVYSLDWTTGLTFNL